VVARSSAVGKQVRAACWKDESFETSLDQNLFALILLQKLLFNTTVYTPALLDDDSLINV
jgi:hypothetical protein